MAVGGPIGAAVGGGLGYVKGIAGIFSRNNAKKKAENLAINKTKSSICYSYYPIYG